MADESSPNPLGNLESLWLAQPPRRVVSLVPSLTGSLFDLGLGQHVVGVTDYCVYPPKALASLPRVGGTKNPDVDRVRALQPDLVLANQEENRPEDVRALQAAGIPVWVSFPQTVRGTVDVLWAIVRVFDAPHLSRTLDTLEKSYEWASLASESQPRVRVFCPIWREPPTERGAPEWWMTVNRHTYVHDLLRVCGGENVFAARDRRYPLRADLDPARPAADLPGTDTRYPRVTPAEVAAAMPEVILLPSEPYPFGEGDPPVFNAWPEIPAVQSGRIYLVDGSLLTWPGTHLARALAEVPAWLFPTQVIGDG